MIPPVDNFRNLKSRTRLLEFNRLKAMNLIVVFEWEMLGIRTVLAESLPAVSHRVLNRLASRSTLTDTWWPSIQKTVTTWSIRSPCRLVACVTSRLTDARVYSVATLFLLCVTPWRPLGGAGDSRSPLPTWRHTSGILKNENAFKDFNLNKQGILFRTMQLSDCRLKVCS